MTIDEMLRNADTVAVIGCSAKQYRTSHHIAKYLIDHGFTIIPINPNEDKIFGLNCLDSINEVPVDKTVDIVNIFRNKKYTLDMVKEIVEWKERTGQTPVIWTQLDVSTEESKNLARESGFQYVENRCMMVEHRKEH